MGRKRCGGVVMSAGGEAAVERERGGEDASWANMNLTGPRTEGIPRDRFKCYKWTMNI
jgi:hypothetical protein